VGLAHEGVDHQVGGVGFYDLGSGVSGEFGGGKGGRWDVLERLQARRQRGSGERISCVRG